MRKIFFLLLFYIFFFSVNSASTVSAKIISSEKGSVIVSETEVIDDDLIVGAQTVEIDGIVNGDVFIGAQTVKISGTINGSLHVGANTLDINGTVTGNVYTGAQNVLISDSTIGGSLLIGAATVNLNKDTSVGGSIFAGAGALSIDSHIQRSVYAGTGSLRIGRDAIIGKDLYYASGKDKENVIISDTAQIVGSTFKTEINSSQKNVKVEEVKNKIPAILTTLKGVFAIFSFIGALIVGFLYFKLFDKHAIQTTNLVSKSFWKTFGIGFLVAISLIPGLFIMLLTVIGIPLAGLVLLLFLLYSYLAKIIVGTVFGKWISQKFSWKMPFYGSFVIGLLVIYLIGQIPFIGFLSGLIVLWVGLGALTLQIFSHSN